MNKTEFLNILRQSLSGEVAPNILEENISYYDGYIGAQTVEEENRSIEELGDPRLIAKSIIEAERAAKEKSKGNWSEPNHQGYTSEQEEEHGDNSSEFNRNIFFANIKWYHKLIAVVVVIVIFVIVALIGRLLLSFLFAFGLPILLLVLVISLLRKR